LVLTNFNILSPPANIVILEKDMKKELYKIDLGYPFFFAMVISAFVCAFALFPWLSIRQSHQDGQNAVSQANSQTDELQIEADVRPDEIFPETIADSPAPVVLLPVAQLSLASVVSHKGEDEILKAYRDPLGRDQVTDFFSGILHSPELAQAILTNADIFNIPPGLAFALCWEESRFKVRALNQKNKNGSIDRGLFQLNDYSFPHLSEKEFFDPGINSYYGLSHLRWCLDSGGSLVAGLAMYNAGTNRVTAGSTPKRTLDYVSNILNSKQRIEDVFEEHQPGLPALVLVTQEETAESKESALWKPRLSLLSPAR
jgi:hypothetical protein